MKTKVTKYSLLLIAAVLLVAMAFAGAASAAWDGTSVDTKWYDEHQAESTYYISTEAELAGLAKLLNDKTTYFDGKTIKLSADLDLDNKNWIPIGHHNTWSKNAAFKGTFDGQGNTIKNLYICSDERHIGLFGTTGEQGVIKNLNIDGVRIERPASKSTNYIGSLVGYNEGKIDNCNVYNLHYVRGQDPSGEKAGSLWVGGLVGESEGPISNCEVHSESAVSGLKGVYGYNDVGGLVAVADSTVENCYADCDVYGYDRVGGLIGNTVGSSVKVTNSEAKGNVNGNEKVGGLIGQADYNGQGVEKCSASGDVSGKKYVGGLIGKSLTTVSSCQASGDVTSTGDYVGGLTGYNDGDVTSSTASGKVIGHDRVGGLIGYVDTEDTIQSCSAAGSVEGNDNVGGLAGFVDGNTKITKCSASGSVEGNDNVGGLIGIDDEGTTKCYLDNCHASGAVKGINNVGGLIGYAEVFIDTCYAEGDVEGENYVGGVVGRLKHKASDSYATGNVAGDSGVGGFVGSSMASSVRTDLTNCKASGDVTGYYNVGGFAGHTDDNVINCHASGRVEGNNNVGGLIGSSTGPVLFGWLLANKDVKECSATGNVNGHEKVGGLIGESNVDVSFCHATGDVTVTGAYAGGLIGTSENRDIKYVVEKSYATGNVKCGGDYAGGLIGYINDHIYQCYASGNVQGKDMVGGLVGKVTKDVENCYATGDVEGNNKVGGLSGWNYLADLKYCYATGSVKGNEMVGGLSGLGCDSAIRSIPLNPSVSGNTLVGTIYGMAPTGDLNGNGKAVDCCEWVGIKKTGDGGLDVSMKITSYYVWDKFSNGVWKEFGYDTDIWQANIGNGKFMMPTLKVTGYDTSSDARHLNPESLYTVDFNVLGHGTAPDEQLVAKGEKVAKPVDPLDSDYMFSGWYREPSCINKWNFETDTVAADLTLYAKWTLNEKLTVVFDVLGHGTAPDPQYVDNGGKAAKPVKDPTAAGWTFSGWYKDADCTEVWNFDTDTVTGDTTIYAGWKPNENIVRFSLSAPGTAPDPQYVATGEKVTRPEDPLQEKFVFNDWYPDTSYSTPWDFGNDTVSGNMVLYAAWIPKKTIIFNVQGHGVSPGIQYVVDGEKATKPGDPQEDKYVFGGWYKESSCVDEWNFDSPVTENMPLYAKWTPAYYVVFDVQGHGTAPENQLVEKGNPATEPADPLSEHYTFVNWCKEPECTNLWDFSTPITKDTILYANWTGKPHTVIFEKHNGEAADQVSAIYGELLTEPSVPTKQGAKFSGWYTAETGGYRWNFASNTVEGDMTLHAQWAEDEEAIHSITVSPPVEHCAVDVSKYSAKAGEQIVVTILPDHGYSSPQITSHPTVSISTPERSDDLWIANFTMPGNDVTLSVSVLPATSYGITLTHTGNGTIVASPSSGHEGDKITFSLLPDERYGVKDDIVTLKYNGQTVPLYLNSTGSYLEGTFMMPACDVTASADFIKTVFTVSAIAEDYGSLSFDRSTGSAGDDVTFTIIPDAGYEVATFTINGVEKIPEIHEGTCVIKLVDSDLIAHASFQPRTDDKHTITNATIGNGRVSTDKSSAYSGETIHIDLRGDKGYQVKKVSYAVAGGTEHELALVPGDGYSSAEFIMPDTDVTVTGEFEPMEVAVTFNIYGTGSVEPTSKMVTYDAAYGKLPVPERPFNAFDGWYTSIDDEAEKVTASDIVDIAGDHTLYAKWIGPIGITNTLVDFGTLFEGYAVPELSDSVKNMLSSSVTVTFPGHTRFNFFDANGKELTGTSVTVDPEGVAGEGYVFTVVPDAGLPAGFYSAEIGITYDDGGRSMGSIPVTLSILPAGLEGNAAVAVPQLPEVNTLIGGPDITGMIRFVWVEDGDDLFLRTISGSEYKTAAVFDHGLAADERTVIHATNVYDPQISGFYSFVPFPNSLITAAYPVKSLSTGGTYQADIGLKEVSVNLPSLTGEFKDDVASAVNAETGATAIAMVSTLNDASALDSMNSHIVADGVRISFTVPRSQIPDVSKIIAYHVDRDGDIEELDYWLDDTTSSSDYIITVIGSSFSSYVLGLTEVPHYNRGHSASLPKDYTPSSSVPVMVQETTTPTTAPTIAAPTMMPTTKPASSTSKSPAPFAGLVLGFGAAALVLARMRR